MRTPKCCYQPMAYENAIEAEAREPEPLRVESAVYACPECGKRQAVPVCVEEEPANLETYPYL